jgi:hypothetical protein
VVTVTVDSGWGKDGGEAVQELESREAEGGTPGGIGLGEQIENLIGTASDEMETVESKGRPGTVPDESFQPFPIGSLDTDACVQAEPTAVIPGEHILGVMGFEETVATEMPQDPGTDGMLEALQELGGESCGLVEA